MSALPGFRGFKEGLWVADSSLFNPTYSRRLLFGFSAYLKQPLMLVPALRNTYEFPSALVYSLASNMRRDEESLIDSLFNAITSWVNAELRSYGLFGLEELSPEIDTLKATRSIAHCFTPDRAVWRYPRDVDIVVEALLSGAEFVATNNMSTIRHSDLNAWARENLGFNRDIIGDTTSLARRYLDDDRESLLLVATMSAPNERRRKSEEIVSVTSFLNGLAQGPWKTTGVIGETLFAEMSEDEVTKLLDEAFELARTPYFVRARRTEDELQTIRVACLQQVARENQIAPFTDHEKGLIKKFGK